MAMQQQNGGTRYPGYIQQRKPVTQPMVKPAPGSAGVLPEDQGTVYSKPAGGMPPVPPVAPRPNILPMNPDVVNGLKPPVVQPLPGGVQPINQTMLPGTRNEYTPGMNPVQPRPDILPGALPAGGGPVIGPSIPGAPNQPIPLRELGALLERQLGNPSRFDPDLLRRMHESDRDAITSDVNLDAAKRGMYYSTSPNDMLTDRLSQADLQREVAVAGSYGDDIQRAIGNAMQFGQLGQQGDLNEAQILAMLGQLGFQGEPTIPGSIDQLGGQLPFPQGGGTNDALMQILGMLSKSNGGK